MSDQTLQEPMSAQESASEISRLSDYLNRLKDEIENEKVSIDTYQSKIEYYQNMIHDSESHIKACTQEINISLTKAETVLFDTRKYLDNHKLALEQIDDKEIDINSQSQILYLQNTELSVKQLEGLTQPLDTLLTLPKIGRLARKLLASRFKHVYEVVQESSDIISKFHNIGHLTARYFIDYLASYELRMNMSFSEAQLEIIRQQINS